MVDIIVIFILISSSRNSSFTSMITNVSIIKIILLLLVLYIYIYIVSIIVIIISVMIINNIVVSFW